MTEHGVPDPPADGLTEGQLDTYHNQVWAMSQQLRQSASEIENAYPHTGPGFRHYLAVCRRLRAAADELTIARSAINMIRIEQSRENGS